jgi:hypothetical protein
MDDRLVYGMLFLMERYQHVMGLDIDQIGNTESPVIVSLFGKLGATAEYAWVWEPVHPSARF